MKCIYYDGRLEGAADTAKAMRRSAPPDEKVVTRDAAAWLQLGFRDKAVEKFEAVLVPSSGDFDPLAQAHADAGADVHRADLQDDGAKAAAEAERQRAEAEAAAKAEAERAAAEAERIAAEAEAAEAAARAEAERQAAEQAAQQAAATEQQSKGGKAAKKE